MNHITLHYLSYQCAKYWLIRTTVTDFICTTGKEQTKGSLNNDWIKPNGVIDRL